MVKTKSSFLLLLFLVLSVSAGLAFAREINKDFHQRFDVKKGDILRLRHGDGNVQVIPWEENVIDVKVRYRADIGLLASEALAADIKRDDGDVTVDLEKGFSLSFQIVADDADYIRVELDSVEDYREDRTSKSGRIKEGTGRLKIRTADGNITIREN